MSLWKLPLIFSIALILRGPTLSRAAVLFQAAPALAKGDSSGGQRCPGAEDVDELLSTASSLLERSRFEEAVTTLQPMASLHCDYRISLLLAAAFEGSREIPGAERVLQQALAVWPANSSIATSLARYYLQDGDTAKAEDAIAQCKPNSSTPLRELQMMAMVYLENQNLPRSQSVAVLAYQRYPSEETLLFLANVLQLQGRYMDVIHLLQKNRAAYSGSAPFLITIAESEYDGTLYGPARQDLDHAIVLDSKSYAAHYLLGNVLVNTGNIDGGIREYKTAIQLSPQQPRTYYHLGLAFEKKADEADARSEFERSLSVNDHYAPAFCELGKLDLRANHLQDAVENLNRALEYNPSLQETYFLLVQAYARLGERDKSHAVMDRWTAFKNSHRLLRASPNQENPLTEPPAD